MHARWLVAAAAGIALLAACADDEPDDPGSGSGARPASECPTGFSGDFTVVGRFPVKAPGVDFAITGDRVAFADANGSASYDVRLVGLAGASAPTLDVALLQDVSPLPVSGEVADSYAPLQLAAARDGVVTAHGKGRDVVLSRFDRAGYRVWQQAVRPPNPDAEVYDVQLVDDHVYVRFADIDDYPGSYGVQELSYRTGRPGEWRAAAEEEALDAQLDLEPAHTAYRDFGVAGGPVVSVPDEGAPLAANEDLEPPDGIVTCGSMTYRVHGIDLWPIAPGDPQDPALGDPVHVDAVPEVTRHAGKGDGAVMGVTPDAVWVGWRDLSTGEGTMFALSY